MTANEIRIGNYYQDRYGNYRIVEELSKSLFVDDHFDRGVSTEQMSPIPLTEEILLKAGFEKDIESLFYRNNFIIAKTISRWAFYHNGLTGGELVRIDYIHQLQNLFFALTGEEIKIEL